MLKIKLIIALALCCLNINAYADCVILLHGLTRSAASMEKMDAALSKAGYTTINIDYPSTQFDIQTLVDKTIPPALKQCQKNKAIHFVTHSLGGILVRYYLVHKIENNNEIDTSRIKRVVMLGPPNQGSEVVDKLKHLPGFYWINGDAGMQLGTDETSIPSQLGAIVDFELGVIAGSRSINLFLSTLIPGTDDGKVSIKNSKVEGMEDHIVLPVTHPFMMRNNKAIKQTLFFLEHGRFDHKTHSKVN